MMLVDHAALWLNLLSIAFIGLVAGAGSILLVWVCAPNYLLRITARAQKNLLWLSVIVPWVSGIVSAIVFLPSVLQFDRLAWFNRFAHWHHPQVFHLDSWHSAALIAFVLGVIYGVIRITLSWLHHQRALGFIRGLAIADPSCVNRLRVLRCAQGGRIVVVDAQAAWVFAAGLYNPTCYVTTGLVEQISDSDLAIILAHEYGHIENRDTAKKILFALLASLYPKLIAQPMTRLFSLCTERLADARVARNFCAFDIAETLVKTARAQRLFQGRASGGFVNYFYEGDLEVRVKALVAPSNPQLLALRHYGALLLLAVLVSCVCVDVLHHLIEIVFSH